MPTAYITLRHFAERNVTACQLAAIMGLGRRIGQHLHFSPKVMPVHTVIIGGPRTDQTETENIRRAGYHRVYTMREHRERGILTSSKSVAHGSTAEPRVITSSLDMVGIDPEDAPGVGTYLVRGERLMCEAHRWQWRSYRRPRSHGPSLRSWSNPRYRITQSHSGFGVNWRCQRL